MRLAIAVATATVLLGAAPALADPPSDHEPRDPCKHNPTTLCDDDGNPVVVAPEPPGPNCPAGGVRLTVGELVVYVCNGVDGEDGSDGAPGAPGADGAPGQPGAPGLPATGCISTRLRAPLLLPSRFPTSGRVRVRINQTTQLRRIHRTNRGRRVVVVSLRGLGCGVYPVVVRRTGVRPALRIWKLKGGSVLERFTIGNLGTGPSRPRPTPSG